MNLDTVTELTLNKVGTRLDCAPGASGLLQLVVRVVTCPTLVCTLGLYSYHYYDYDNEYYYYYLLVFFCNWRYCTLPITIIVVLQSLRALLLTGTREDLTLMSFHP
jgi:hypothetical protein